MTDPVSLRDLALQPDDPTPVAALKLVIILTADGNATRFARAVGKTPQAVRKWFERGRVPAEEVLALERHAEGRVSRHVLRGDLYPEDDPADEYGPAWRLAESRLEHARADA